MNIIANLPGYKITEELYTGSRTLVYRGIRSSDQQPVVIKILRHEYPSFNELVQFRHQYTIAKNLDFPNIVKPLSLEVYGNSYALIMEDCGGVALYQYLESARNKHTKYHYFHVEDFLKIAIQIADTLHYLHQNRVIHKDIKPANLLINPDHQQVKLIDFSISFLLPREAPEVKNPHILEGTLCYISPEQTGRMNRGIDYRSDFYSLGVTCYELLTGKLPFQSSDVMELVHCHLAKQPPPIHEINPNIPIVISEIVSKLMAKNAEDRYQSALGIKYDLEECLHQLQETGNIDSFAIAQQDISDRFMIPEKLYGREAEVQQLLAAFDRVNMNQTEMMLVAGFSGIGKTAVINEVHKPIVRQRGYFIKGKYDQFNRHIPWAAFVQAFRDLMGQILSESDAKIQTWKTEILEAVGENGQVLIDVIPELEKIIGPQPPAVELSGNAAQNRFNLLFQKFLQVFTSQEHPLVIFLDDWQWSDSASLNLLQLLMQETQGYLLILGAYRDHEVSPVHPFILTVDEIIQSGATVNTITLSPLPELDINQLVADTLNCQLSMAKSLAKLVYQKTHGNPFFATQLLKALHDEKLIVFEQKKSSLKPGFSQGGWQCDMAKVQALTLSDDVVEFMALPLQKLPKDTQDLLKLAACIGSDFDLNTLAIVSQKPTHVTAVALWKALQEGLIIPTTKIYKFFTQSENQELFNSAANPTYRFLHDRIQQASYSLIPDHQKQATHLQIGQLLQHNLSPTEVEEKLFDIVGHLNLGHGLITDTQERETLAQLNLSAAQKARNSTAYVAARNLVETGLELLADDCWESQYQLALNMYVTATETAYLNADFDTMETLSSLVQKSSKNILDKVKIYEIQINALTAQSRMLEAIAVAENALKELGVEFSSQPDEALTAKTLETISQQLEGKKIEDLVNFPVMEDPETLAAMELLGILFAPIFLGNPTILPLLGFTMVSLSLRFGNAPTSTIGYAIYGMVLSAFLGEVKKGYKFGRVALILLDKFNVRKLKALTLLLFGTFLQHRQEPLRSAIPTLKNGYMAAIETGQILYAGYNIFNYFYDNFFAGVRLDNWEGEIDNYCVVLEKAKQDSPLTYLKIKKQMVYNFREIVDSPYLLKGNDYNEIVMIPKHHHDNELTALAVVYIYKLILAYLFGEYHHAGEYIAKADQYLMAVGGTIYIPVFHFYAGLTYLALCSTSKIDQDYSLDMVKSHQKKLAEWAESSPNNHQHKVDLLAAEKCRFFGEKAEAIDLYDRAITGAKDNKYIQEEALANELAAKFYLNWGKAKVAAGYMQDAYYGYAKWGAKAKVADLEKRYPKLLNPILHRPRATNLFKETIARGMMTSTHTSSSISEILDLTTLLQASQAISSEIELDKLISNLLKIVINNAGANKCILVLKQDDKFNVVAILEPGKSPEILPSIPLEASQDLPISVVNNVRRTGKYLVLADARINPRFYADTYIQNNHPKSVICIPIINQGQLMGILYLENNLTIGAFTSDRVELLKFLCSQAAISLENGRLYEESQTYNHKLKQYVEKLELSEARYRYLATATSQIIWLASPEGENLDTVHWIAYTGQTLEEVKGRGWLNALHPDDLPHTTKVWQKAVETKSLYKTEYRIRGADGIYRYFAVQGVPIFAKDGSVKEWIGTCTDIDARRRAENKLREKSQQLEQTLQELQTMQLQLVQNEKMSALGNLVAGVAHEINNPVGCIKCNIPPVINYIKDLLGLIDLYQEKYSVTDDEIQDKIESIELDYIREDLPKLIRAMREAVGRIQDLSVSLRTFSRADTDRPVACHIHDGIDSTLMILKHRLKANQMRPEIQVIKEYGNLPHIKCYAGQLNQVFMNILSNAIDALDESNKGRDYGEINNHILVKTELSGDGNYARIRIKDNGVGISDDVKFKIFEHLFTTKNVGKGTGLGLAIARQIVVDKHSGMLEVNSTLGEGTEFVISIPC
ncbi:MAG: AAA family ATPase [Limnospira sp. PMC 894.15]|uniref:AAA family ATPase n=1 Tax=unclassified Limnospira TaxID=2642885 RepID=UPI00061A9299|nr:MULTISPECIES: AAA family ATPase [unclassified Limnospira]MDT9188576.1 AAA family ATPase [Limnospira sp. PMC 894.15]MDT9234394.1 AAA family ATPase [Limnospira sp. PMC 917.15]MDT9275276.1 AAA family ATPase [Limnospira sp. PMC 737.11]